jgi:hypothetical protein
MISMPDPDSTPEAAPEAAPAPAPDPAGRIASLEDQLGRERAQREVYEATFRALGPQQTTTPGISQLPVEAAQRIARRLGGEWNEQEARRFAPIFQVFLEELAAPLLVGIEGMADAVDLVQVRQEVPQYETISQEADRVRQDYRSRGQVITRKQAVALVKSRRMDDPRYLDELVDKRAAARAAEQAERSAGAAATVTAPAAPAEKVGPAPTKGSRGPITKEEFARLSLEEKRKVLGDTVI